MGDPPVPTLEDRLLYLQEFIENVADDVSALTYLMQEQTKNVASLVSLVEEALVVVPPDVPFSSLPLQ